MYPSTRVHPLLFEAGLVPASTLLNYRQRSYAYRLLSLPDEHPAQEILPVSLRIGDENFQPGELSYETLMWTENTRPKLYGQWLAWQLITEHSIDPANRVEPVPITSPDFCFKGKVIIENREQVLHEATKNRTSLVFWTDRFKARSRQCGSCSFFGKIRGLIVGKT